MLQQQLDAAEAQAVADGIRWREEVNLKQARIDMLAAGDRSKEADFMTQRVKELQVCTLVSLAWSLHVFNALRMSLDVLGGLTLSLHDCSGLKLSLAIFSGFEVSLHVPSIFKSAQ